MTNSGVNFRAMIVGAYINELFVDGTDAFSISILREALVISKLLNNLLMNFLISLGWKKTKL